MPRLLTGTVTFLFTDIESSTALLGRLGQEEYERLLTEHEQLILGAATAHGGRLVDTQGDALFLVFGRAREAAAATVSAQQQLAAHEWPDGVHLRVRMGLHTGEPHSGGRGYIGTGVHRAKRIGDAAHGGQILVSQSTRQLLVDDVPPGIELRDIGVRKLRGLDEPDHLYQLLGPGLRRDFPPPRTGSTARLGRLSSRRARLAVIGAVIVVVGAAVSLAVALRPDSSRAIHLQPNSLAAFDARAGHAVADVPLGFTPVAVAVDSQHIWAIDRLGQTVTAVDAGTMHVAQTTALDGVPGNEWAGAGADWVALSQTGSLDEIAFGSPANEIPLWKPPELAGAVVCDLVVTGNNRSVWVSQGRLLAELDPRSGRPVLRRTLPAVPESFGTTCYGVRYTGGRLLALREPDGSIGTLDVGAGAYTPILTGLTLSGQGLGGSYASWAAAPGSIWFESVGSDPATLAARFELLRADESGNTIGQASIGGQADVGGFGGSVALATGALALDQRGGLWTLAGGQTLAQVEPTTLTVTRRIDLGHPACCVATGLGRVWVPLESP
jgi:class 3 adenylate cyclase